MTKKEMLKWFEKHSLVIPFVTGAISILFILIITLIGIVCFTDWLEKYNAYFSGVAGGVSAVVAAVLVGVTIVYAIATKQMADEMRAQTVVRSRPITIPRPVHASDISDIYREQPNERFQWFEVYNAGNGPAVDLEVIMLNEKKAMRELQLEPFLRPGEHITFIPSNLGGYADSNCYVLCRYQSVLSKADPQIWYETWLSFKPTKSQTGDKVYVQPNELKFEEVSEKVSY